MLVNSLSGLHNFAFLVPFSHYLSILSKKIVKTSKYPTQSTLTEQLFSFFCKIKIIPIVNDYKFLVVSIQEQYFQLRLKITRPWSKSRNWSAEFIFLIVLITLSLILIRHHPQICAYYFFTIWFSVFGSMNQRKRTVLKLQRYF